ncbi:transposase [Streptomyces sp. NBC_00647]|uniref:transposase n=1 Tax=Streptomyces sp. NBC_00647 TaxID=2975796 RepID=UPI003870C355
MGGVVEPCVSGPGGGYPWDLTDEQWAPVEPLLPAARVGPKGGRREKHPRRRIVDGIFYVVRTGCAWRQLPKDFPPWPTVPRASPPAGRCWRRGPARRCRRRFGDPYTAVRPAACVC